MGVQQWEVYSVIHPLQKTMKRKWLADQYWPQEELWSGCDAGWKQQASVGPYSQVHQYFRGKKYWVMKILRLRVRNREAYWRTEEKEIPQLGRNLKELSHTKLNLISIGGLWKSWDTQIYNISTQSITSVNFPPLMSPGSLPFTACFLDRWILKFSYGSLGRIL